MVEAVAISDKSLEELFADIEQVVGFRHVYDRADLHLSTAFDKAALMEAAQISLEVAGQRVTSVRTTDGVKLTLQGDVSVMFRASGTEPVVRVYVEAQTPENVQTILNEAVRRVRGFDRSSAL